MELLKKPNQFFIFLFLSIFLISFAYAGFGYDNKNLGTFKLGDDINLIQTCSNCTFNNITSVLSPNSTQTIGEFAMTQTGTIYNFTLSSNNITNLGTYIVNGFGDLDGIDSIWSYTFILTQSGAEKINQGEGIVLFGIILILILVTIFFLVATIFIENPPFKVFLGSLAVLILISTLGFGVTIMQQLFGTFTNIVSSYTLFFRLFMVLLGAAGISLVFFLVVFAMKLFSQSKGRID